MKLNEQKIRALQSKETSYSVKVDVGLFLRVSPTGTKSWVLRYYQSCKVRDFTLGRWPELTLLQAKQAARLAAEAKQKIII